MMPAWGSPASSATPNNVSSQFGKQNLSSPASQQNPFSHDLSQQSRSPNSYPYQRSSPYSGDSARGRKPNNFQNTRNNNESSPLPNRAQAMPDSPFRNKMQNFSGDNPFQRKGQNFSPHNPFQKYQSPSPRFSGRSNLTSSPTTYTPGSGDSSFGSRRPENTFHTPPSRGVSFNGSASNSMQRSRSSGMFNPGASNKISDYIHPSMLEDPWRDLPPVPLLPNMS